MLYPFDCEEEARTKSRHEAIQKLRGSSLPDENSDGYLAREELLQRKLSSRTRIKFR